MQKQTAQGPAAAAGAVALALGVGVVMSALAINLTDAAVASAVFAAGESSLLHTVSCLPEASGVIIATAVNLTSPFGM